MEQDRQRLLIILLLALFFLTALNEQATEKSNNDRSTYPGTQNLDSLRRVMINKNSPFKKIAEARS